MRISKPTPLNRDRPSKMRQEDAEVLAISALGHIAADDERLERFLAVTGIDPANLRSEAGKPGFVAGVLDYVCADESLLIAFAAEQGLPPEAIAAARRLVSGAAGEDW